MRFVTDLHEHSVATLLQRCSAVNNWTANDLSYHQF